MNPSKIKTVKDARKEIMKLWFDFQNHDFKKRRFTVKVLAHRVWITKNDKLPKCICQFFHDLHEEFLKRHIELTVREVKVKYRLTEKTPTAKDFYRICKAESINIVPKPEGDNPFKVNSYIVDKELPEESFITLDARSRGEARRKAMFALLGFHFLHKQDMLSSKNRNAFAYNSPTESSFTYNAFCFQLQILAKENGGIKNA